MTQILQMTTDLFFWLRDRIIFLKKKICGHLRFSLRYLRALISNILE